MYVTEQTQLRPQKGTRKPNHMRPIEKMHGTYTCLYQTPTAALHSTYTYTDTPQLLLETYPSIPFRFPFRPIPPFSIAGQPRPLFSSISLSLRSTSTTENRTK